MIDLTDLGLKPVEPTTEQAAKVSTSGVGSDDKSIQSGSLLARSLFHLWRGDRVVQVESPPGAGKTTLINEVVYHLLTRTELSIVVACPTKRGMSDMASRLVELFGTDEDSIKVVFAHNTMTPPPGTVRSVFGGQRSVTVRTIDSCKASPPAVDILIFDEAFQCTFAKAQRAAGQAQQVFMVGDPGQIGPVNKVPSTFWDNSIVSPAARAPEGFAKLDGAITLNMDTTYRIGDDAASIIAPLYGFEFVSGRPDRFILDDNGQRIPEVEPVKVEPVEIRADARLMDKIAQKAVSFIGKTVREFDPAGNPIDTKIEAKDIAVVVPHNDQVTTVGAYINKYLDGAGRRAAGESAIYVGTADKSQGGQWKAVVALDPMIAHAAAGTHQLALGRLCVMLSRQTHHMTWVHDGQWEDKFSALANDETARDKDRDDANRAIAVRRLIMTHDRGNTLD